MGLSDPQEVFDIHVFRDDPSIFYQVAKDILPDTTRFSPTHAFIELLQRKGKLLTNYTQNIDNLEFHAGIEKDKLVQCHGSFATATCVKCGHQVPGHEIFPDLRRGRVAKCDACIKRAEQANAALKRKRKRTSEGPRKNKRFAEDSSADEDEGNYYDAGVMKVCDKSPRHVTNCPLVSAEKRIFR
jgi:NAD+-dependent protein deacetylase SIR2